MKFQKYLTTNIELLGHSDSKEARELGEKLVYLLELHHSGEYSEQDCWSEITKEDRLLLEDR